MNRPGVLVLIGAAILVGAMFGAVPAARAETGNFSAVLLPANEVPPVTNADVNAFGSVTVTLDAARDADGFCSGTGNVYVGLGRFPATDSVTRVQIHAGLRGANGPVIVDAIANPPIGLAGDRILRIENVSLNAAPQLCDAFANPTGYYVDVHTSASPNGAVRGQLERSAFFSSVGLGVFTNAATYKVGDPFQIKAFAGNAGGSVSADVLVGLVSNAPGFAGSLNCTGTGNVPVLFFRPGNTFTMACSSSVGSPGSPDVMFARGLSIPSAPLDLFTLINLGPMPREALAFSPYLSFVCLGVPDVFPFSGKCAVSPLFAVGPP